MQRAHPAQAPGVREGRAQEGGAGSLAAPRGFDVHAPQVRLAGGLDVARAVDAEHAVQAALERPEHQRAGAVLQLRAHGLLRGGDVIFGGG